MSDSFDLVVIGGGPGGYAAALYGASAGLNVAMVEKDALGGTCLNRGCIPAKAFLETAAVHRHVDHAAEFGIEAGAPTRQLRRHPGPQAEDRRRARRAASPACCKGRKVDGRSTASARSAPTTRSRSPIADGGVDARSRGDAVVLAAGSVPRTDPRLRARRPDHDERRGARRSTTLPARVAVIGGGAIGCEFASTFADLGAKVTILEGLPKILPGLDADVANVVVRSVQEEEASTSAPA